MNPSSLPPGHRVRAVPAPGRGPVRLLLLALGMLVLHLAPQASVPAWASQSRASAPSMAGDLIVKFRDTSEMGVVLAAVLGGTRTVASAAPIAARLSAELGVPLRLVHVMSGGEAVLAIDREALLASLARRAAHEPGVLRATPSPAAPGLPPDQATVRLKLKPGASAQGLEDKLASGPFLRPRLARDGAGATLLVCDMPGLTAALLEGLKQRADVEYAQANRRMRPLGATVR
jgi:hypothetical protein